MLPLRVSASSEELKGKAIPNDAGDEIASGCLTGMRHAFGGSHPIRMTASRRSSWVSPEAISFARYAEKLPRPYLGGAFGVRC